MNGWVCLFNEALEILNEKNEKLNRKIDELQSKLKEAEVAKPLTGLHAIKHRGPEIPCLHRQTGNLCCPPQLLTVHTASPDTRNNSENYYTNYYYGNATGEAVVRLDHFGDSNYKVSV